MIGFATAFARAQLVGKRLADPGCLIAFSQISQ
jgi:hypothetical protein